MIGFGKSGIEVELNNRRSDFQESIVPRLLTTEGTELDLPINPAAVLASVPVQQNFFTKEVSIRADILSSTLANRYEIRSISITPASVTLSGERASIDKTDDYLSTAPLSLEKVYDQLVIQAPLVKPEGLRVLDETGDPILSAQVKVEIAPVEGYLVLEKTIELRNIPDGLTAKASQYRVTALIIGPQPLSG